MRIRRDLAVVMMGCLTVTAVTVATTPAYADPDPGTSAATDALGPDLAVAIRDALTQLRPLPAPEVVPLRDRLIGDIGSGVLPIRSASTPAWEDAMAFGLPDGRTMVVAPARDAEGDSLAVLYDSSGAVSRHVEANTITQPDQSMDLTAWIDDQAPMHTISTAAQLHDAAARVHTQPVVGTACAVLVALAVTWLGLLAFSIAVFFLLPFALLLALVTFPPVLYALFLLPFACTIGLLF